MNVLVGVLGVVLSAGYAVAGPAYPLKIAFGQRYLVDQNGVPFFMVGDAPQEIMVQVSTNDLETYLADRASRGFNTLWVFPCDRIYQAGAPGNYYGQVPFDGADFTNEDAAYWALIDYELNRMAFYGMTVLFHPGFVGLDSTQGYYSSYLSSSDTTMLAYGTWLGNRYKGYTNIIWTLGGDADPTVSGLYHKAMQDLAISIHSNAPNQLITFEATRYYSSGGQVPLDGFSSMDACGVAFGSNNPSWLDLNWVYKDYTYAQEGALTNYWRSGALPALMGEDWYEGEHSMTPLQIREESYWECLSGCNLGRIFGNNAIWTMGGPYDSSGLTWQSQLGSPGSLAEEYLGKLFRSREFWLLIPDLSNSVLTAGYQSGTTLAVCAKTSDKHTVIAYIPTQRAVTIAMTNISGTTANAWWYSPTNGTATAIGSYNTTGTQSFTPASTSDWVLVLDDAAQNYLPPGESNATPPEALQISPAEGFVSSGPFGGPFSVTNQNFTLTNIGSTPLNWDLGNTSLWLSASSNGGTLVSGGAAAMVNVGLNSAATSLAVGVYTNTVRFTNLSDSVSQGFQFILNVSKATPTLSWSNAAAITYGTALSTNQLDATANVPGTFAYDPSFGTVLNVGSNILSVIFTPTDKIDYSNATDSVSLLVSLAPIALNVQMADNAVVLNWGDPASLFVLQAAPTLTGVFTNVPGAASPYSNAITGAQQYFRLVAQ